MKKDNITTVNEAEIEKIGAKAEEAAAAEEYARKFDEEFAPEKLAEEYDRKYGGASDDPNGETVSAAKATEADGEITEAKVLALIERMTDMAASIDELAARLIPLTPEIMEVDEYSDRVMDYNMIINSMIKGKLQMIELLNATANRMLDYLEKKRTSQTRDEANADISDILALIENPVLDKEMKQRYKQLLFDYHMKRLGRNL